MGREHPLRGYLLGAALAFTFWTFLGLLFTPQTCFADLPANPSFSAWRAFVASDAID